MLAKSSFSLNKSYQWVAFATLWYKKSMTKYDEIL